MPPRSSSTATAFFATAGRLAPPTISPLLLPSQCAVLIARLAAIRASTTRRPVDRLFPISPLRLACTASRFAASPTRKKVAVFYQDTSTAELLEVAKSHATRRLEIVATRPPSDVDSPARRSPRCRRRSRAVVMAVLSGALREAKKVIEDQLPRPAADGRQDTATSAATRLTAIRRSAPAAGEDRGVAALAGIRVADAARTTGPHRCRCASLRHRAAEDGGRTGPARG